MTQLFANNAYGSLAAEASAVTTTLTLGAGQGLRFPSPTGGDFFLLTLVGLDENGNEASWEIVKVTARASDTLTVVRAQESTTAVLWPAGTRVELRVTAGMLSLIAFSGMYLPSTGGTLNGNLAFSGNSRRITGDFTNATIANRTMFQTSTVNGATQVGFLPNGTAVNTQLHVFGASDPTNAPFGALVINSTQVRVVSAASGSGTALPLTMYVGTTEVARASTSHNWLVGTATDDGTHKLQVAGAFGVLGADAAVLTRLRAATGMVRVRPYLDATNGVMIDSTNAAESAYLPLTLQGSSVRLFGSSGTGLIVDSSGVVIATTFSGGLTGNASTATTLQSARTINGTSFDGSANITTTNWGTSRTLSFTGDVTGSSAVNGSANVATAMTLANSGVTAGTYTKVTVDAKGRVTTGASLASSDLPTYTGTITSTQVTNALGFTPVQQNGGAGHLGNKLYIGWLGSTLGLQVDTTNFGATWPIGVSGNAATATTATNQSGGTVNATNINYSGTLTGDTGVVNIGSAQIYKNAAGDVGLGTNGPAGRLHLSGTGGGMVFKIDQPTSSYTLTTGIDDTSVYWSNNSASRGYRWINGNGEQMRLSFDSNLSIGTSNANGYRLYVNGTVYFANALTSNSNGTFAGSVFVDNVFRSTGGGSAATPSFQPGNDGDTGIFWPLANTIGFSTAGTERMRIDSSGNWLVGKTSTDINTVGFRVEGSTGRTISSMPSGAFCQFKHTSGTGTETIIEFVRASSVGTISTTTTSTAYNTASDYRLKNIEGELTNSGGFIDALRPVYGTWKADGSTFIGLIAHEVDAISQTKVATGEKDQIDADGNPVYQAMDYSNAELIANLIAEVKSLRKRVAQLEGA